VHICVNFLMEFIYTPCKCTISIYIHVSVNVEHRTYKFKPCKYALYCIKQRKCKKCEKCDFYFGGGGRGVHNVFGERPTK
jgi:hypothetical protein